MARTKFSDLKRISKDDSSNEQFVRATLGHLSEYEGLYFSMTEILSAPKPLALKKMLLNAGKTYSVDYPKSTKRQKDRFIKKLREDHHKELDEHRSALMESFLNAIQRKDTNHLRILADLLELAVNQRPVNPVEEALSFLKCAMEITASRCHKRKILMPQIRTVSWYRDYVTQPTKKEYSTPRVKSALIRLGMPFTSKMGRPKK